MIDPAELKAAADAHDRRLETVWTDDRRNDDPMAGTPMARQRVEAVEFELPEDEVPGDFEVEAVEFELPEDMGAPTSHYAPEVVSRLDAIEQALAALTHAVTRNQIPTDVPEWLCAAVGDLKSYDVPDSARMSVKVRVLPNLYTRLEQTRVRFGLQTLTGTWECLLRLGLIAAERLPVSDKATTLI
jgi:hypothetical protein